MMITHNQTGKDVNDIRVYSIIPIFLGKPVLKRF